MARGQDWLVFEQQHTKQDHCWTQFQELITYLSLLRSMATGPSLHGCHGSRNKSQVPKVPTSQLRAKSYRKLVGSIG